MALDKDALKANLLADLLAGQTVTADQQAALEDFAEKLATRIDEFVKTGQVTIGAETSNVF